MDEESLRIKSTESKIKNFYKKEGGGGGGGGEAVCARA